jgi:hypothetical protein
MTVFLEELVVAQVFKTFLIRLWNPEGEEAVVKEEEVENEDEKEEKGKKEDE